MTKKKPKEISTKTFSRTFTSNAQRARDIEAKFVDMLRLNRSDAQSVLWRLTSIFEQPVQRRGNNAG